MGLGLVVILLFGQLSDTKLKAWVDAQHRLYALYRTRVPILGWRPDRSHIFGLDRLRETDTTVIQQLNESKLYQAPDWAGPMNREGHHEQEKIPHHYEPGQQTDYWRWESGRAVAPKAGLLEEPGE